MTLNVALLHVYQLPALVDLSRERQEQNHGVVYLLVDTRCDQPYTIYAARRKLFKHLIFLTTYGCATQKPLRL